MHTTTSTNFSKIELEKLKQIAKELEVKHHFAVPDKFYKGIKHHFEEYENVIIVNGGNVKGVLYLKL